MPARPSAAEIKRLLQLEELPVEGGYFRQTYLSADQILKQYLPERYTEDKPTSTAILFLLTPDAFSAFHQLPTDEVYHYYLGDPAELFELHPDGTTRLVTLGADIVNGHQVQHMVPRGTWQASRVVSGGEWALLGTTMAPGYTQSDFLLGYAANLIKKYPSQEQIIRQLTRDE